MKRTMSMKFAVSREGVSSWCSGAERPIISNFRTQVVANQDLCRYAPFVAKCGQLFPPISRSYCLARKLVSIGVVVEYRSEKPRREGRRRKTFYSSLIHVARSGHVLDQSALVRLVWTILMNSTQLFTTGLNPACPADSAI